MMYERLRLLLVVCTVGLSTAACPSFRGKEGMIGDAVQLDLFHRVQANGCPLSAEEWQELCYEPVALHGIKDPAGCPDSCLARSRK